MSRLLFVLRLRIAGLRPHARAMIRAMLVVVLLCQLFVTPGCWTFTLDRMSTSNKPVLPPLVPPKDAIMLEVFFIDRPSGDPLLGTTLWRELDEVGAVSSTEARERLRKAGIRVGSAGSRAPQMLRAAAAEQRSESEHGGQPQRMTLLSGGQTTLEVGNIDEQFTLRTDGINGETVQTYPGARCVLRVFGERVQDGWVRLTFQPELHYGPMQTQRRADDGRWKLQQGQKSDRFLEQRFDVELHLGELVVIGAGDEIAEELLGARFFHTGKAPSAQEQVIVLRVEDLQQIKAERAR